MQPRNAGFEKYGCVASSVRTHKYLIKLSAHNLKGYASDGVLSMNARISTECSCSCLAAVGEVGRDNEDF